MKKKFNEAATQTQALCQLCKKPADKGHDCRRRQHPPRRRSVGI